MKARPILFSAPMIRALLAGTKTQTRRVVKPQPAHVDDGGDRGAVIGKYAGHVHSLCPYGAPGDILYVKESWAYRLDHDHLNGTQLHEAGVPDAWYWADGPGKCCNTGCDGAAGRVRAARFMPRWASRLTLRITDVRVQRLQEISYEDACAEGCEWTAAQPAEESPITGETFMECSQRLRWPQRSYAQLWESINGVGSWAENPWVWALSFEVIQKNVGEVLANG